jgi:hypothetical protein
MCQASTIYAHPPAIHQCVKLSFILRKLSIVAETWDPFVFLNLWLVGRCWSWVLEFHKLVRQSIQCAECLLQNPKHWVLSGANWAVFDSDQHWQPCHNCRLHARNTCGNVLDELMGCCDVRKTSSDVHGHCRLQCHTCSHCWRVPQFEALTWNHEVNCTGIVVYCTWHYSLHCGC